MKFHYALTAFAWTIVRGVTGDHIYPRDRLGSRLAATDIQSSSTLDDSVVQPASSKPGSEDTTVGRTDSLTSTNNFINFCAQFPNVALTNGLQNPEGSCNGIPMGHIMAKHLMPSQMILYPKHNDIIAPGTNITIFIKTRNIQTGVFTATGSTYFSAPQQLNDHGVVIGHSHIVVEELMSIDDTEPSDMQHFAFFKALNDPADSNGVLNATVVGLKAGFYRLCTIGSTANHAPILLPLAKVDPWTTAFASRWVLPPPQMIKTTVKHIGAITRCVGNSGD